MQSVRQGDPGEPEYEDEDDLDALIAEWDAVAKSFPRLDPDLTQDRGFIEAEVARTDPFAAFWRHWWDQVPEDNVVEIVEYLLASPAAQSGGGGLSARRHELARRLAPGRLPEPACAAMPDGTQAKTWWRLW